MDPVAEQEILSEIKHLRDQEVIYRQEAYLQSMAASRDHLLDLAQQCVTQRIQLEEDLAKGASNAKSASIPAARIVDPAGKENR
jgi:hypothetical protein